MRVTRADVLRYRVHAQQLDRSLDAAATDADVLDLGVQDTGPDGAAWALVLRGTAADDGALLTAWTLRGAPHVYRRAQAGQVAAATAPFSEADARKRVFDASRPLKAAGIPVLDALDEIAAKMRALVTEPTVKGEVSTRLTPELPEPYRRFCRACNAVHLYEQTFRIAALRGGLELRPGTSPPVLERIRGWRGPAARIPPRLDPVRAVLHLLGPATPKLVAGYLDAPVKDVTQHWPSDVVDVEVRVNGQVDGQVDGQDEVRSVLEADADALSSPKTADGLVRLLGPFDLFLQGRDRELVVPDATHRKDLWRMLGRPGAVLSDHEIVGTWRPRAAGSKLRLAVDAWGKVPDLTEQAERLAAFRGVEFAGFVDPG